MGEWEIPMPQQLIFLRNLFGSGSILIALCAMDPVLALQHTANQQAPVPNKAEVRALDQLKVGLMYEEGGRLVEAETAYAKALVDASPKTRDLALKALTRIIRLRGTASPETELRLADMYERLGRLGDAETLYGKVITTGTPDMRVEALQKIRKVIEQREGLYEKHVRPIGPPILKTLAAAIGLFILIQLLRPPLRWYGRRKHRNSLAISGFGKDNSVNQGGFGDVLAGMHDSLARHFQPRDVIRSPKMPALVQSQSAEIFELLSGVNVSLVPFAKWMSTIVHQPAYRITGSVESTSWHINVRARLVHLGTTIAQWNRTFPLYYRFEREQDLAYEILLRLKEYVDAHAS
jgi:hypothetical protein